MMLTIISQQFYCVLFDSTAGPCVLLLPTGASESYRKVRSGMCFDRALVILGLYEVQRVCVSVCWCGVIDEHWAQRAEERPDSWQELGSTFHLHMMQPWGTCYIVWDHELTMYNALFKCMALPQRAKLMWTVHYVLIGSTSSHYVYFSFFTWKSSENSTEPALVCLLISMLPTKTRFFFFFYNPCHILFLVWSFFFPERKSWSHYMQCRNGPLAKLKLNE